MRTLDEKNSHYIFFFSSISFLLSWAESIFLSEIHLQLENEAKVINFELYYIDVLDAQFLQICMKLCLCARVCVCACVCVCVICLLLIELGIV